MYRQTLATLAAVGVLSLAPANALAAPITATQLLSFSLTDTLDTAAGADVTLEFDQFDASLGTLTEIVLAIGNPSTNQLLVMHPVGSHGSVMNADFTWSISGVPLVPSPLVLSMNGVCSSCNFGPADLVFSNFSSLTATYPVASQPNLAIPFIGGGVIPVILSAHVAGMAQDATLTGTWSGAARLDYTYEPATAVPEPASSLLLFTGVSGVAWRRGARGGQA